MQLKYRGVAYQANVSGVDVVETEQMGVYRGAPFRVRQANITQRRPAQGYIYRGVAYER